MTTFLFQFDFSNSTDRAPFNSHQWHQYRPTNRKSINTWPFSTKEAGSINFLNLNSRLSNEYHFSLYLLLSTHNNHIANGGGKMLLHYPRLLALILTLFAADAAVHASTTHNFMLEPEYKHSFSFTKFSGVPGFIPTKLRPSTKYRIKIKATCRDIKCEVCIVAFYFFIYCCCCFRYLLIRCLIIFRTVATRQSGADGTPE